MDHLSPARRSENMAAIKSAGTAPELAVRKILHGLGYRYRLHDKKLPGRPDLVFAKRQAVIFVHGCFWHGHGRCTGGRRPKSNTTYWNAKLERNIRRDRRTARVLRKEGWKRVVIWECELKNLERIEAKLQRVLSA